MLTGSTATLGRLTAPHWSGYTSSSPDLSLLERGQIVLNYIPAGVKVSIEGVAAVLTDKVRLVSSVRTGDITAPATLLGSVACIYIDYSYSLSLSFILYKLLELSKVPAVYPASILLAGFDSLSDTFELFKDDYSASRNETDYFLGYLMVNSSPKPFLLLRKLFKMSFCRRSAFGLKSFAKCEIPFRNSSYVSTVKELVDFPVWSGNYCKFAESEVNSNVEVSWFYIGNFLFNGNVEEKLFELFVILEVSRGNFPVQILLEVIRDFNPELLSSLNGSKGNFLPVQPYGIETLVVAYRRIVALGTSAFETFFLFLNSRFETFSSYNSCGDYKLGRERGLVSDCVVGEFVEFNSIPEFGFPTNLTGVVIGKLILFNSLKEYLFLSFSGFKSELNSSLQFHIHILLQYLQTFKCGLLPALKSRVSDRKEAL